MKSGMGSFFSSCFLLLVSITLLFIIFGQMLIKNFSFKKKIHLRKNGKKEQKKNEKMQRIWSSFSLTLIIYNKHYLCLQMIPAQTIYLKFQLQLGWVYVWTNLVYTNSFFKYPPAAAPPPTYRSVSGHFSTTQKLSLCGLLSLCVNGLS